MCVCVCGLVIDRCAVVTYVVRVGYVCGLVIDRCAVVTYVSEQSAVDAVSSDVLHLHNR